MGYCKYNCGYEAYQDERVAAHEENYPEGCMTKLRERAIKAEAQSEVRDSILRDLQDKFTLQTERLAQLLNPKNAKELGEFLRSNRY